MRPEAVRWGVLGVAGIAVKSVIPAMLASEMSRVVAIASRSAERSATAAESLGIPTSYGSYEALLADPDVEAVYIPLPNHLHSTWTLAAAAAGKHVLCEKPLALTGDEAVGMIDACASAGVKLMEAFMYRLHPLWIRVKQMVAAGAVGDLVAVQAVFSYYNDDPDDIRNTVAFGGGALYDVGCYPINVARHLFESEPSDIAAILRRDESFGTDVVTSAILDFDGRQATFTCSTQMEDHQRVDIFGTTGRMEIEIPFNIPPDRPTRILCYAGGDPPAAPGLAIIVIPPADPYGVEADLFSRAIREGTPVPTPPDDAVANLRVVERVFEAAASRP